MQSSQAIPPAADLPPSTPANRPARSARVAVFGSFYPAVMRAGSATTGLVYAIANSDAIEVVDVYAPEASAQPASVATPKVRVKRTWSLDDPRSLLRTLWLLTRESRHHDAIVFSIYPTSFGRTRASNAIGLLLPSLLSCFTRRRPIVFMHSFLETQDVERLGFSPGVLEKVIVRFLEHGLLMTTVVVVPLESQSRRLTKEFGRRVAVFFPRFLEAYVPLKAHVPEAVEARPGGDRTLRILLFGAWGPQKDHELIFSAARSLDAAGRSYTITLAGKVNPSFPDRADPLTVRIRGLDPTRIRRVGFVREEDLVSLMLSHDVLVLPYRATGGYSGVMNVAAAVGIRVLVSDLPQIRECAELMGTKPTYFEPEDPASLGAALVQLAENRVPVVPAANRDLSASIDVVNTVFRSFVLRFLLQPARC